MLTNYGAEQALLGSMLHRPDLTPTLTEQCPPRMYAIPKHADLASVLAALGTEYDPQLVLTEITGRGLHDKIGGAPYLHTLMERALVPELAHHHAADVVDAYRRRRTLEAGERLAQYAANPETDLDSAWLGAADAMDEVAALATPAAPEPAPLVADLLAQDHPYDWLVDGLLERGDRLILTGGEGTGKSYLLAQIAICLAAGCHPFTGQPIPSVRVLIVDCENSRRQLGRRYRSIVDLVSPRAADRTWLERLHLLTRPEGMDLAGVDGPWLDAKLASTKPDVLVIGPLYRLATEDLRDEAASKALSVALDAMRIRHGLTVLTEAHSGHAEDGDRQRRMRPYGSSLWLRWPEFGYGLRRAKEDPGQKRAVIVDYVGWRGDRDERHWPDQLEWGGSGRLPWVDRPRLGIGGVA